MHNAQIRGMMPSASFSLTREIAKVALLYGYGFGAVLHSETTLYMAQEISPITWYTNSTTLEILQRGES